MYAVLFADTGLSTGQISVLFIIWSVTTFALEVPSGAWADVVSLKSLLVLAAVLYGCCFALWTLKPSFVAFAAGVVLWGTSSAITSGAYEAYVFDHLAARGELRRYSTVIARAESAGLLLNLAATVSAAPLIDLGGYSLVGWVSVAICAVLTGLALLLEPNAERFGAATANPSSYLLTLRTGLSEALRVPSLRRAVFVAAMLPAFLTFDEYFPLLAVDLGAARSQIPLLIAVTVAAQAAGALAAPWVPRRWVSTSVAVAGAAIATGALSGTPLGFAAIALGYGLLQMAIVVADTRLQHAIETAARATVTSVRGLLAELGSLAVFAGFALGSQLFVLPALIGALAVALFAVSGLVRRWLP